MMKADSILLLIHALGAGFATFVMSEIAIRYRLNLDPVNPRSSHVTATSRLGGVAMMLGFGIALFLWSLFGPAQIEAFFMIFLVCVYAGMMIGLADDLFTIRVRTKFLLQFGLAVALSALCGGISALPYPGGSIITGIWAIPLGALWAVAFVNAFNFMDGVNGLAAGTALLALMIMTMMLGLSGQSGDAVFFILLAGALMGFFVQNYRRGRIFLGDSGSHALGFVIAACAFERPARHMLADQASHAADITSSAAGGSMMLVTGLLFLPHIIDVAGTILSRARRGEIITAAHKDHFYQKLHQRGWRHYEVADIYIVFTAVGGIFALAGVIWGGAFLWVGLCLVGLSYCVTIARAL